MAKTAPKSYDESVSDLISWVGKGKMQLPDFQRDWTWDDDRIRSILASLTMAFPMGAIMCLEYGDSALHLKRRCFEGVDESLELTKPEFLVLDGQQRLTSLYLSLCSEKPVKTKNSRGEEKALFYYADIKKCLDEREDRFDAIISVPEDRVVRTNIGRDVVLDISKREFEIEQMMFPLNIVFNASERQRWYKGVISRFGIDSEEEAAFTAFQAEVLDTIDSYKIPTIKLGKDTSREAVCKVFENVNTGGVSLTVFELVTASFAMDGFSLREDWENTRKAKFQNRDLVVTDLLDGVDATTFLTAVTLYSTFQKKITGTGSVSCKKKDVLSLEFEDYKKYADSITEGFISAAQFLIMDEHIFRSNNLPYSTQLIPLSAAFAYASSKGIANKQATKDVFHRWLWCGILGEMYGGANETRYANDIEDLADELDGKPSQARTVNSAYFQAPRLLGLQTKNSAAYKGIMALIFRENCRDFISGTTTSAINSMAAVVDIHHIFPKAYCEKQGFEKAKWNSIVNKTPLLGSTNRTIGGTAPSSYSKKIVKEAQIDREELADRIASHLVDFDSFIADDFETYFVDRAKRLLDLIEAAMDKPISDRDSEETIERFGKPLTNY